MTEHKYQAYNARNFREITQLADWPASALREIETVARVLPFKTNNYVVDELIDWDQIPGDPMYTLNFPRRELLRAAHWQRLSRAVTRGLPEHDLKSLVRAIQLELNPDPSSQSANVPLLNGHRVSGAQHKYRETVLFFPQAGQSCHAFCTFCFRWPQFVGFSQSRFSGKDSQTMAEYLKIHPRVTDLLITGGDPMTMRAGVLETCLTPFLGKDLAHLRTIRIGTKSLSYWPYRYLSDPDSDDLLRLFDRVVKSGRNLSIMAHFNHPVELSTEAVRKAIIRLRGTGAQIRTQSPLLHHINDKPELWAEMWRQQVDLNCIPYYMFVERDTGAKHFFALPLERCWQIFRQAYQRVSGLGRTVKGPVMSATPGKVEILGVTELNDEKVFMLRFIQGRNADWVDRPFFALYDRTATWLNGLKPAFGEHDFFFEKELKGMLTARMQPMG
ncbi:MAG: lysine 2,3-aminomutase [Candidatus Adiutrix sp.]|jgi:KamA family protein|nr:lysine 2,3-aminomutase [Candidatus Adiutrix sp.]